MGAVVAGAEELVIAVEVMLRAIKDGQCSGWHG